MPPRRGRRTGPAARAGARGGRSRRRRPPALTARSRRGAADVEPATGIGRSPPRTARRAGARRRTGACSSTGQGWPPGPRARTARDPRTPSRPSPDDEPRPEPLVGNVDNCTGGRVARAEQAGEDALRASGAPSDSRRSGENENGASRDEVIRRRTCRAAAGPVTSRTPRRCGTAAPGCSAARSDARRHPERARSASTGCAPAHPPQ